MKMNLKDFQYLTVYCDEHWFHGTGCQYPLVCPKGTKVKFIRQMTNLYGKWFEVEYEGEKRYIMPSLCEGNVMVKVERYVWFDPPSCSYKEIYFYYDRYGKKYKLLNEKGELELYE